MNLKKYTSACIKLFFRVGKVIEGNPVVHRRDFVFEKILTGGQFIEKT